MDAEPSDHDAVQAHDHAGEAHPGEAYDHAGEAGAEPVEAAEDASTEAGDYTELGETRSPSNRRRKP